MTRASFRRQQARAIGWLKQKPSGGGGAHVHFQVKEVAVALAGEMYELAMSNNQFRADFKEVHQDCLTEKELIKRFVDINWAQCIPTARATLAGMLKGPYDAAFKDAIMEALSLDATLIRGRTNPALVLGSVGEPRK